ncbi:hypothetical protein Aple_032330 [Acrocarpospora pleiomorpha]|uniref:Uncharacterized protein n=1 Tax=Acrocarpospora pleiomorpha TaxID=90975 RepID=A0A5M3XFF2_9ACTN|nr:hypothetical protein [Acrocarpospora pleiomorpha]GES20337.1 hypothetical protein Aple_032330 [Acrocarpospora pleiomorpha]
MTRLSTEWEPRRDVRAVEQLRDGRILAALDGVGLESWLPSGEREWSVADEEGGREIAVAGTQQTAWVSLVRPDRYGPPQSVVQLSLSDGGQLDHVTPSVPVSLVRSADGRPLLAPSGDLSSRTAFPVRSGSRLYVRTAWVQDELGATPKDPWVAAVELSALDAERPGEPAEAEVQPLFPHSWIPGEIHFGGPGVETTDGDLVHAGTVYDGRGLQPGGSFVVRRSAANGTPRWIFRTDRPATALDADSHTAYVAYDDGEIVSLDLHDGRVRSRGHLTVGAVTVFPTALTVTGPGRLLIGTSDGRILDCSAA